MNVQRTLVHIVRFVRDHVDRNTFSNVPEPRAARGRRFSIGTVLNAVFVGLVANARTLRDIETLTGRLASSVRRRTGIMRRISDTALYHVLSRLSAAPLLEVLAAQIRRAWRSKTLAHDRLRRGLVAIDGKQIAVLDAEHNQHCQKHNPDGRPPYWLLRVLRAVLISSSVRPTIGQMPICGRDGEITSLPAFIAWLVQAYGSLGLFEGFTLDAGLVSEKSTREIDALGYAFVGGLKGNQPQLHELAERRLGRLATRGPAEVRRVEWYAGRRVTRMLWRLTDVQGENDWHHLRQIWLVRQRNEYFLRWKDSGGRKHEDLDRTETEDRYFVTNFPNNALTPDEILDTVRAHWAIENDSNWTADVVMNEDGAPMCRRNEALIVLGILRMMAYNVAQMLRQRRLRGDETRAMPWRTLFGLVAETLVGAEPWRKARLEVPSTMEAAIVSPA